MKKCLNKHINVLPIFETAYLLIYEKKIEAYVQSIIQEFLFCKAPSCQFFLDESFSQVSFNVKPAD